MVDLVFNIKVRKYFNTNFTYALPYKFLLDNASITAFILGHIFVNAEISAFPNLHTLEIVVSADVSVLTNMSRVRVFVNVEISAFKNMTEVWSFGDADISAFKNILPIVNSGISAYTYMKQIVNPDICASTIGQVFLSAGISVSQNVVDC